MGTIKADSIQPTIAGNNLILRTGSDVERVRISPTGDINVSGNFVVSVTGNAGFVGNVGVTGNITTSGKITSESTTGSDSATTLTTKGYVDPNMMVILDTNVILREQSVLGGIGTTRQTLELHPHVPSTARYVILTFDCFSLGNTNYFITAGPSTVQNSGHRVAFLVAPGDNDNNIINQVILPINKISSTSRQIYWNASSSPALPNSDFMGIYLNGYIGT